jgi:hypothetical protein
MTAHTVIALVYKKNVKLIIEYFKWILIGRNMNPYQFIFINNEGHFLPSLAANTPTSISDIHRFE